MSLFKLDPTTAVLASTCLSACVFDYQVGNNPLAPSTTDATTSADTPGTEPTSGESTGGQPTEGDPATTSGTTDQPGDTTP